MFKYIDLTTGRIIGMAIFFALMVAAMIWAASFRKKTHEIIKNRNYFFIFSAIIILISIGALVANKGVHLGLDFTGGTVIQLAVPVELDAGQIGDAIAEYAKTTKNPEMFADPKVQVAEGINEGNVRQPSPSPGAPATEAPASPTPAAENTSPKPVTTPASPAAKGSPAKESPAIATASPTAIPTATTPSVIPTASPIATPSAVAKVSPTASPKSEATPAAVASAVTPSPEAVAGETAAPEATATPAPVAEGKGLQTSKFKIAIVQVKEISSEQSNELVNYLRSKLGGMDIMKIETIGPTIGGELKNKAFLALAIALIAQLLYITFRFGSQLRYGVAADIALLHDLIVMVGLYTLFGKPVDSPFIAALLTIVGYSVMDSIVVFDRIRENLRVMKGVPYEETVNLSLNQVMTRSVATSFTVILTVFAIYYFGGSTLQNFSLALLIGLITGTYSSLFIASPLVVMVDENVKAGEKRKTDERRARLEDEAAEKAARKTEGASVDDKSGRKRRR